MGGTRSLQSHSSACLSMPGGECKQEFKINTAVSYPPKPARPSSITPLLELFERQLLEFQRAYILHCLLNLCIHSFLSHSLFLSLYIIYMPFILYFHHDPCYVICFGGLLPVSLLANCFEIISCNALINSYWS